MTSTKKGIKVISAAAWPLQGSWILDNETNSHVCNRTMYSSFTKTHDAGSTNNRRAGTQVIPVECFGTIQISINSPIGFKTMTLLNTLFASSRNGIECKHVLQVLTDFFLLMNYNRKVSI